MKYRLIKATVLSAVIMAGTLSANVSAAESVQTYSGFRGDYTALSAKGVEKLKKTLEELGIVTGQNGFYCQKFPVLGIPTPDEQGTPQRPNVPELPEASEQQEKPDTPTPEISEQQEKPNSPSPEASNQPEKPDSSVQEKPEVPEVPNQPEVPTPEIPDQEETNQDELSYAEQVVKLVNTERAKAGLPALKADTHVTLAANVRAKEIKQNFSHTRPNGSGFGTALREQGVSFRGSGENIAWGQRTAQEVMNNWMNSSGHRANILDANFKNIGVGFYVDNQGRNHWVQLFTY